MTPENDKILLPFLVLAGLAAGAVYSGLLRDRDDLPDGIVAANGRIEAEQVEVAAKAPGRIAEILVTEGDPVTVGTVLVRRNDEELQARIRGARAGGT